MKAHSDHNYYIEEGFKKGRRARVLEICDKFEAREIIWVKKNSGSKEDGEDVFQNAMLVIVNKSNDLDFILKFPFGAYLHGICRLLWYKELEKRGKRKETENFWTRYQSENPDLAKAILEAERIYLCNQLRENTFRQLTELCQKVLNLYSEGKNVTEIGNILEMAPNAVSQRIFRCKVTWKDILKGNTEYENCKNFTT